MPADTPTISVSVRTITATDELSQYKTPDQNDLSAVYVDYVITNRYEGNNHIYMAGVTSAEAIQTGADTVALFQLTNKTTLWIVDWTASRWKLQPNIPDPTLNSQFRHWYLLNEHIEAGAIEVAADGVTPRYRISGSYFYATRRPAQALYMDVRYPKFPFLENFATRTVPASAFQQDISS